MSGTVIVAGARTPIGRLLGGLKSLSAADLGGVAIKGALEKAGVSRRPGRLPDHGPGHPGRRRPEPRPQRGHRRWPAALGAVDHGQQGLPVGAERDRPGRPPDQRRRGRHRGGRRHGVDDQRPPPAAEVPRGLQVRRHHAGRLDGLRRALRPGDPAGDGRADRGLQRLPHQPDPRGAGRLRGRLPPEGRRGLEERRLRRRGRPGLDPAAQGRPGRGQRRTRACAATRRSSRCRPCARRSARTAPSPPARPPRSPTAPARSW